MTSAINVLYPVAGSPTTQSVRDNFTAAKNEIEALQRHIGFADYNDTATTTTPISVSPTTWTKLTNNKLGSYTQSQLPSGITNLWNGSTNQMVLSELPMYSMVDLRMDIEVTTTTANQVVKLRGSFAIGDGAAYQLELSEANYKTSGVKKTIELLPFYIGNTATKNNPAEIQIYSDAACTVKVNGWYFKVIKYIG